MNIRTLVIAVLIFFSLAPATLADGNIPLGGDCTSNPSGCVTGATCIDNGTGSASYCAQANPVINNNQPQVPNPTINNSGSNTTLINPLQGGTSLESFLNNILAFVIRIGTIIVILMLVYVGYLFCLLYTSDAADD